MDENAEGAMAGRLKNLMVAQHTFLGPLLGDGRYNIPQRKVPREEGNIVYLIAPFSYVESP
jgi:hypothetical protein